MCVCIYIYRESNIYIYICREREQWPTLNKMKLTEGWRQRVKEETPS